MGQGNHRVRSGACAPWSRGSQVLGRKRNHAARLGEGETESCVHQRVPAYERTRYMGNERGPQRKSAES
jgi:hypothetical protein